MIPKSWEDIAAMVVLATATIGAVTWLWNRRRHFRGMLRGIAATRQRGYQRLHSSMLIRLSRIAICFAPGQYLLHLAELIYRDFPGLKDSETSIQLAIALSFLGHVDEATKINLVGAAYGRWYADDPSQAIQLLEKHRHERANISSALRFFQQNSDDKIKLPVKRRIAIIAEAMQSQGHTKVWCSPLEDLNIYFTQPARPRSEECILHITSGRLKALRRAARRVGDPAKLVSVLAGACRQE